MGNEDESQYVVCQVVMSVHKKKPGEEVRDEVDAGKRWSWTGGQVLPACRIRVFFHGSHSASGPLW